MVLMEVVRFKNGHNMGGIPGGPKKLTVPQAIVSLLTYALEPRHSSIKTQEEHKLTIRSPYREDIDIVTYETNNEAEMDDLFLALNIYGTCTGKDHLVCRQVAIDSNWERFQASGVSFAAGKWALFMTSGLNDDEENDFNLMLRLAQFCIEDIADAIDIICEGQTDTFDELIPAMVRVRPLR